MNPFKGTARYGATPAPETPYQRAGQAWDQANGAHRTMNAKERILKNMDGSPEQAAKSQTACYI